MIGLWTKRPRVFPWLGGGYCKSGRNRTTAERKRLKFARSAKPVCRASQSLQKVRACCFCSRDKWDAVQATYTKDRWLGAHNRAKLTSLLRMRRVHQPHRDSSWASCMNVITHRSDRSVGGTTIHASRVRFRSNPDWQSCTRSDTSRVYFSVIDRFCWNDRKSLVNSVKKWQKTKDDRKFLSDFGQITENSQWKKNSLSADVLGAKRPGVWKKACCNVARDFCRECEQNRKTTSAGLQKASLNHRQTLTNKIMPTTLKKQKQADTTAHKLLGDFSNKPWRRYLPSKWARTGPRKGRRSARRGYIRCTSATTRAGRRTSRRWSSGLWWRTIARSRALSLSRWIDEQNKQSNRQWSRDARTVSKLCDRLKRNRNAARIRWRYKRSL